MKVQGNSLEAVQFSVCRELGYRRLSRKGEQAQDATKHALQYLNQPHITFAAEDSGLTYEKHLREEAAAHVKLKMGVGFWLFSMFLSALISKVVGLVVMWWIAETVMNEEE